LIESVSSCMFLSLVLRCLSNSSSVFPLISILSSSSESLSSAVLFYWMTFHCVLYFCFIFFPEVFHIMGHFLFNIVYFCL
jgi:hypothetical protein